jgi:hypothetical protein
MMITYSYLDRDGAEQWATVDVDIDAAVQAAIDWLQARPAPDVGPDAYRYAEFWWQEPHVVVRREELAELGAAVLDGLGGRAYSLWCTKPRPGAY